MQGAQGEGCRVKGAGKKQGYRARVKGDGAGCRVQGAQGDGCRASDAG